MPGQALADAVKAAAKGPPRPDVGRRVVYEPVDHDVTPQGEDRSSECPLHSGYDNNTCPQCEKMIVDQPGIKEQIATKIAEIQQALLDESSPCQRAMALVRGPRQEAYGHPYDNFKRICDMWSARLGMIITVEDFVDCMVLVKVARNANIFKDDNWDDIAGYVEAGHLARERAHELGEDNPTFGLG